MLVFTQEEALRPVYQGGKELVLSSSDKGKPSMCTAYKSVDSAAVANCFSCAKLLCPIASLPTSS